MFTDRRRGAAGRKSGGGAIRWEPDRCMFCGGCVPRCEAGALLVRETFLELERVRCSGCGACARGCPTGALSFGPDGGSGERGPAGGPGRSAPPLRGARGGGKDE